jgi:hypothetical protein
VERTDHPSSALVRSERSLRAGIEVDDSSTVDLDARRRLLEMRIEASKERLVTDLGRAKQIIVRAKDRAEQGLIRVAIVTGGLLLIGLVTALVRRRKRRIRVTWR